MHMNSYDSTGLAVVLGLFNSFATLMGLDGPTHLAEEIPQPRRHLPRILLIVIISQFFVGVVWILVLGFSITDLNAVRNSATGYVCRLKPSCPTERYHKLTMPQQRTCP